MNDIRNVAIIAHVDHGKTSLVNELLKEGGVFRDNQVVEDRVMDSNVLEKERGITILSKNTAINYKDTKINIVDTPGHADFGGEVERVLKMVDGVILVVDAFEGPMPQTRFVLQKALDLNHKVIIVINKIDKSDARIEKVKDEILELFLELDASNDQLNSPFMLCSAREGVCGEDEENLQHNFTPLLDKILEHIPAPEGKVDAPFQMLVSSTEHNDYLGKLAVGKVERGQIKANQTISVCNFHEEKVTSFKVTGVYNFIGLKRIPIEIASAGDIVCIAGSTEVTIGDTICDSSNIAPIPFVKISEPSVEMNFRINDSPFAGTEGKYCTSRHLRDRLRKEALKDLSLKVFDTNSSNIFKVLGRGEMHLSILMENMRRDGYEFQVSMPHVLFKEINGIKCEPIDRLVIDVPTDCVGNIMSAMGNRKGELVSMNGKETRSKLEFLIPTRGLFGYRGEFLTDTKGEGIMNSVFDSYQPYKGNIECRNFGALIAYENGEAVQYGLFNVQARGKLLITPGTRVYQGMIVGMNPKGQDIVVNVCKKKQLTNTRSSSSDDALRLEPVKPMTLEECLEFVNDDELLEITPKSLRLRKIVLNHTLRGREDFKRRNDME